METKRRLSCIVCPLSCTLEVSIENGQVKGITGNTCKRGEVYGYEEVTSPKRMLATTVRVTDGELPLLPVVSRGTLPKDTIISCAQCLSSVIVKAPVSEGDVVYSDIMNLGVDIIAARDIKAIAR